MNQKPLPPEQEIKDRAKQLRALWTRGQKIRPFLRKQAPLFRQLLHEEWSWAGLALAMTKAGITYETKKPWTADSLLQAFSRAQRPLNGHARRKGCEPNPADAKPALHVVTLAPASVSSAHIAKPVEGGSTNEPARSASRFKPVSIKPFEPRPQPTQAELAEIEQNRRLTFGRS